MSGLGESIARKSEARGKAQGIKIGEAQGEARGMKRGLTTGTDLGMKLMNTLFSAGRIEDAKRAAEDKEYRNHLMKEYNLLPST